MPDKNIVIYKFILLYCFKAPFIYLIVKISLETLRNRTPAYRATEYIGENNFF